MTKERRDQPVLWDQVVSESMKRLSSKTSSGGPVKRLNVTARAVPRHNLTVQREAAKIDWVIRAEIRRAATDGIVWPLVFCGNVGTGKTCAGLCVVDHVPGAEWWAWEEFWRFVQEVNMGRYKGSPQIEASAGYREVTRHVNWTSRSLWKWFKSLPLAVIDDVGLRGDANDTQYESLKQALDQRAGLPMIVTSNLDVVGLGKVFDLRIMDRLSAGTVVDLFGKENKSMR